MSKPSKVLIIGSGPIVIGQAYCHSEGAQRLKNLKRPFASLRVTMGRIVAQKELYDCKQTI